jgi:hypothetical protein
MTNYRYTLRRSLSGKGGIINFIMLNPSTADEIDDDATIRRCKGFAERWGFSGLVVTNLFAYRATQPKDLKALLKQKGGHKVVIGKDNVANLEREANSASAIVCAWGNHCDVLPQHHVDVIGMLRKYDIFCIRKTAKGNPAHPSRERYTDSPQIFYPKLAKAKRN